MPPKAKPMTNEAQIEVMRNLGQQAAAWLTSTNARVFRDKFAPHNPDGSYNAQAIAKWLQESTPTSDDPLLAGSDSPNLERYRAAKANLAEMDAAERSGRLVDVDVFTEWFANEVAGPLRRATAVLAARFGPDAESLVTAALAKAEAAIEKRGQTND